MLEVVNVTKSFLGLKALDQVNLAIDRGEIIGLIGPNGSGKTTLFNCITGFLQPDGGKIIFKGIDITNHSTHKIALGGVTRTFQLARTFGEMSVLDSLLVSVQEYQEFRIFPRILKFPSVRHNEKIARTKAAALLEFLGIEHLSDEKAQNLSYGQQKLLAIAQALMPEPEILLLDEPTSAVNPTLIKEIQNHILKLHKEGHTIFIIEHNMDVVMTLCQRIFVLNNGKMIADGLPEEIQDNEEVIDAYFGE